MRKAPTRLMPTEYQVQMSIVLSLRMCGCEVIETTAYRQRGSTGVDYGVPDLLVHVPGCKTLVGLEVKKSEKAPRTKAQIRLAALGAYQFVWSIESAIDAISYVTDDLHGFDYESEDFALFAGTRKKFAMLSGGLQ